MKKHNKQNGFTLIEILVVIGIIAILAAVVIIAINPARQFAQARNSQRSSNVNAILNAVWQRMVDNKGVWDNDCGLGVGNDVDLPGVASQIGTGGVDIAACVVPTYLPSMVWDPTTGDAVNAGYYISQDVGGRITVSAPDTEIATTDISVTR